MTPKIIIIMDGETDESAMGAMLDVATAAGQVLQGIQAGQAARRPVADWKPAGWADTNPPATDPEHERESDTDPDGGVFGPHEPGPAGAMRSSYPPARAPRPTDAEVLAVLEEFAASDTKRAPFRIDRHPDPALADDGLVVFATDWMRTLPTRLSPVVCWKDDATWDLAAELARLRKGA